MAIATIRFKVVNHGNFLPVQGATVSSGGASASTASDGTTTLKVTIGLTNQFTVAAPTYLTKSDWITFSETDVNTLYLDRDPKYFANWTKLVDSKTNQPIAGATIYINSSRAGTSDSTGAVWVTGPVGAVSVRVTGTGYDSTFPQTATGPQGFPAQLSVTATPPSPQHLTLTAGAATAATAGCTLFFATAAAGGPAAEQLTCANGQATTANTYLPGQYLVTASQTGYTSSDTPLTVTAGVTQYAVQPPILDAAASNVKAGDAQKVPANGGSVSAGPTTASSGIATLTSTPPDYEWIYPNSQDGKYFTATQARIYVGNLFMDELVQIQFTYQGNRIPIYGYSSELADGFGTGRRLVQGQLALNFVTEGYLYTVLKEFAKMASNRPASVQDANIADLTTTVQQYQTLAAQKDDQTDQLQALSIKIQSLADSLGPSGLDLYTAGRTVSTQSKSPLALSIPFDIRFELTGAGRTVTKIIRNCLLTANDQVYDQSGSTLLDAYGFVARSLD
jgi:hypothetical protein